MAPASNFLTRLAPWATQRDGAVRAAVASRFAPVEPEVALVVDTPAERSSATRSESTATQPPRTRAANTFDEVVAAIDRLAGAPRASESASSSSFAEYVRSPVVQRSTPARAKAEPSRDVARRPQAPIATTIDTEHESSSIRTTTTIVERTAFDAAASAPPHTASQSDVDLSTIAAKAGPMRPEAVAQRPTPARDERPTVVEITIDRIDVRVPAANSPTRAPTQPRAKPTQSLADYLRQREQGGA